MKYLKYFVAMLLIFILAGCASARPSFKDPWHVAAIGAGVADVATTYVGLKKANVREFNPVITTICGIEAFGIAACAAALKAAVLSMMVWIEKIYNLDGWEKRIFWLVPTSVWGGAAVWNAHIIWDED